MFHNYQVVLTLQRHFSVSLNLSAETYRTPSGDNSHFEIILSLRIIRISPYTSIRTLPPLSLYVSSRVACALLVWIVPPSVSSS